MSSHSITLQIISTHNFQVKIYKNKAKIYDQIYV